MNLHGYLPRRFFSLSLRHVYDNLASLLYAKMERSTVIYQKKIFMDERPRYQSTEKKYEIFDRLTIVTPPKRNKGGEEYTGYAHARNA